MFPNVFLYVHQCYFSGLASRSNWALKCFVTQGKMLIEESKKEFTNACFQWFLVVWLNHIIFVFDFYQCFYIFRRKYLMWLILLFCETNLIIRKSIFWRNLWWSVEDLMLTTWKKILFYCKHSISSLCTAEDCNTRSHETLSTR